MYDVAFQPLRQSSYHVLMRACRYSAYWPRVLVPTPLDDEGGCLDCAPDWALAAPDDSSNNSAHAVADERMGHRLITWLATLEKSFDPRLISTYRGDY